MSSHLEEISDKSIVEERTWLRCSNACKPIEKGKPVTCVLFIKPTIKIMATH